jgi:hypothetical protein
MDFPSAAFDFPRYVIRKVEGDDFDFEVVWRFTFGEEPATSGNFRETCDDMDFSCLSFICESL